MISEPFEKTAKATARAIDAMVFEHIEKLKQEYTDKYVIVDDGRPELSRFVGMTGMVKTVNMSGRALVEFDGHNNIGWYDIGIDYLKVIDKPLPKQEKDREKPAVAKEKKKASTKAAAKKPSALEKARASDGKETSGKMSVEDILAAARGEKETETASQPDATDKAAAPAEKAAPKDLNKMSVADVLAAARGEKMEGATVSNTVDADDEVSAIMEASRKPKAVGAADSASAALAEAGEKKVADAKQSAGDLPTDIAGIIAFCRERDASS